MKITETYKVTIFLATFFFAIQICNSQTLSQNSGLFSSDATGRILYPKVNFNISGSPYFPEDYTASTIYFLGGGKVNVKAKIYLPEHSILYMIGDTLEMLAINKIDRIEFLGINEDKNIEQFKFLSSVNNEGKYYQVIDSGRVQLLKLYTSVFTESKEIGSATVMRNYDILTSYYSYSAKNGLFKITSVNKLIDDFFVDNTEKLKKYVSDNKISVKRQDDLKKLFQYYNSL